MEDSLFYPPLEWDDVEMIVSTHVEEILRMTIA